MKKWIDWAKKISITQDLLWMKWKSELTEPKYGSKSVRPKAWKPKERIDKKKRKKMQISIVKIIIWGTLYLIKSIQKGIEIRD